MKYLKENWHTLIFPSFFILFVFSMVFEYYKGNCRIGKDIWVCNYIEHGLAERYPMISHENPYSEE